MTVANFILNLNQFSIKSRIFAHLFMFVSLGGEQNHYCKTDANKQRTDLD